MNALWQFYRDNADKLLSQLGEHLFLSISSVLLACVISIPAGIFIARRRQWRAPVLNFSGILQTIPSIALLGFLIPLLGIGVKPAIFALFLYSLLPIVRNVYTGISEIDPRVMESARALGLSSRQRLYKVELPLALPTIFAGIRTATVINVGVATLAAYIAAGGLGEFIFGGIALNNTTMIIAGALPAALLAILLDQSLGWIQNRLHRQRSGSLRAAAVLLLIFFLIAAFARGPQAELEAGYAPEFTGREDGLPALRKTYQLNIPHLVLGPGLMYRAIHEGYVDVISGYSTDGRIKSYGLRVLKDDKASFPPYQAALLIRPVVLEKHPQLSQVIALLEGRINDSLMTYLNYRVDNEQLSVDRVAREFLKQQGLYRKPRGGTESLTIGSKIFTEQYLLTAIYEQLIEGHLALKVETRNGLGGTKICFDALLEGEIDMYPEYSGTALQVLLKDPIQNGEEPAELFQRVQAQLQSRYDLYYSAPIGFNNTYALMIRENDERLSAVHSISELMAYYRRVSSN